MSDILDYVSLDPFHLDRLSLVPWFRFYRGRLRAFDVFRVHRRKASTNYATVVSASEIGFQTYANPPYRTFCRYQAGVLRGMYIVPLRVMSTDNSDEIGR